MNLYYTDKKGVAEREVRITLKTSINKNRSRSPNRKLSCLRPMNLSTKSILVI